MISFYYILLSRHIRNSRLYGQSVEYRITGRIPSSRMAAAAAAGDGLLPIQRYDILILQYYLLPTSIELVSVMFIQNVTNNYCPDLLFILR